LGRGYCEGRVVARGVIFFRLRSSDHAFLLVLDSFIETGKAHPSPQAAAETSIVLDPHPYPKTNIILGMVRDT